MKRLTGLRLVCWSMTFLIIALCANGSQAPGIIDSYDKPINIERLTDGQLLTALIDFNAHIENERISLQTMRSGSKRMDTLDWTSLHEKLRFHVGQLERIDKALTDRGVKHIPPLEMIIEQQSETDWWFVGQKSDKDPVFIHLAYDKTGPIRKGWIKYYYLKPNPSDPAMFLAHLNVRSEFNCKSTQMRDIAGILYAKDGSTIDQWDDPSKPWREISPDSIGSMLFDLICPTIPK